MKKVLSVLLIATMLAALFAVVPLAADAATSGNYQYKALSDGTVEITKYTGKESTLVIPSELGGSAVSSIGETAFSDCTSLVTVTIPNTVRKIGTESFGYCYALETVVIKSAKITINGSFNMCYKLKNVTFTDGSIQILNNTFAFCGNLKSITLPAGVTKIGDRALGYMMGQPIDGFTISGYKGTEAERYAKANNFKFITLTPTLATPKITKFENTASGVKMTWGKVSGAAKYRVFVKQSGKWKLVGDTTGVSYLYKAVKSGTRYAFTVRCLSKDGKKYTSGVNTTGWSTGFIATPAVPVLKNTKYGVQASWKKITGAAKYCVFRKTGNGKWGKLGVTAKLSWLDKTAKKGVTYSYTVRCVSKDGKAFTSAYNTKGKAIKCIR